MRKICMGANNFGQDVLQVTYTIRRKCIGKFVQVPRFFAYAVDFYGRSVKMHKRSLNHRWCRSGRLFFSPLLWIFKDCQKRPAIYIAHIFCVCVCLAWRKKKLLTRVSLSRGSFISMEMSAKFMRYRYVILPYIVRARVCVSCVAPSPPRLRLVKVPDTADTRIYVKWHVCVRASDTPYTHNVTDSVGLVATLVSSSHPLYTSIRLKSRLRPTTSCEIT